MKHFGSILDFTSQRNDEILQCFRRIIAEVTHIRIDDVCRRISESPASRFFVSEERASIVISSIIAGRPLPKMRSNKKEMFFEIHRRVVSLLENNPSLPVSQAVSAVIYQPAPKFYLTPRTIGEMLKQIRKSKSHKFSTASSTQGGNF